MDKIVFGITVIPSVKGLITLLCGVGGTKYPCRAAIEEPLVRDVTISAVQVKADGLISTFLLNATRNTAVVDAAADGSTFLNSAVEPGAAAVSAFNLGVTT